MRKLLLRCYWKLEKWTFPSLKYSHITITTHYDTLKATVRRGVSWLDLGCGHQMFAAWMTGEEREFSGRASRLIGIDLDFEGLKQNAIVTGKIYGNLVSLPLPAAEFDIVTTNMVVEHLNSPNRSCAKYFACFAPAAMLGPAAIIELLLYLRLLERNALRGTRSNLIVILEKCNS